VVHAHRILLVAVLLVVTLTPAAARQEKAPAADDLLKAVGKYLEAYATKASGTALDEF
jgi:hypothetical protein